jgi:hypothetical protein
MRLLRRAELRFHTQMHLHATALKNNTGHV